MAITRPERVAQRKLCFLTICLRLQPLMPLLLLFIASPLVIAQEARIHRCIGENGEPTFSDHACNGSAVAPQAGNAVATSPGTAEASSIPGPALTQTCARSPEDLRARAMSSFSARNGVGLSGLFLWNGYGEGSADSALQDLATLITEPVISIEIATYSRDAGRDRYVEGDDDRPPLRPDDRFFELIVRTVAEQERHVPYESTRRLEMSESGGCWWLQLP